MSNYKIAVVPGDGIGNEIVPEGLRVIEAVAKKHNFSIETETTSLCFKACVLPGVPI